MNEMERKKMLAKIARGGRWYSISNEAGPVAEVRIYDEIGWFGITAEDFVNDLAAITAPEIVCAINCPGGDVFDGIAIYNALRAHPAQVTTRVDSLAASVASVIVQGGDRRVMLSSAQMMIHEAWGITIGTAAEMREFADLLDRQTDIIAGIYASRANGDVDHFRELMAGERWFTDAEAVAEGLADEVVDPGSKDAPAARLASRTLNDELADAMDVVARTIESAERVDALRAEKGKELSHVNRDGLDGLRERMERLNALLSGTLPVPELIDHRVDCAREDARFAALNMEVQNS